MIDSKDWFCSVIKLKEFYTCNKTTLKIMNLIIHKTRCVRLWNEKANNITKIIKRFKAFSQDIYLDRPNQKL